MNLKRVVTTDKSGHRYIEYTGIDHTGKQITIHRGWLRNGGECWQVNGETHGFKTLREAKRYVETGRY